MPNRRKCGFTHRQRRRARRRSSVSVPAPRPYHASDARVLDARDAARRATRRPTAVRGMFDAIAPRYDLVNRIMTFRLDVRWRRLAVGSLALRRDSPRARPGLRHRRPVPRARGRRACGPSGVDLSFGMLAAARTDAPLAAGRRAAPAGARRLGRRRDLRLRPAQPRRAAAVLRRAAPRRCAPAAASPCSRWPSRPTRCCAGATASTSARWCPCIGGLLSDASAYRYLPRSVAYLPEPDEMLAHDRRRRVHRRRAPAAVGRHLPAADGHEAIVTAPPGAARRPHPAARRRRRPAGVRRRRRLRVRAGPGRRSPGGAWRCAIAWPPGDPADGRAPP